MFAHVSMRRCIKSLVTAAGIADRGFVHGRLYNRCYYTDVHGLYHVHTFLHQSTNSVVNRQPACLTNTDLER